MKTHVENSKKFELDKLLIKQIYNIKEKKKPEYKVIKKNVVYDKQLTKQYFNYLDINKSNYYGNYQSFREYLSSGYNSEFLINEINNIKSILGYSENLRHIIERKLNPDLNKSKTKKAPIIQTPDFLEGSNSDIILTNSSQSQKINNDLFKKSGSFRRPSTVFQVDKENPLVKRMADLAHKNVQLGQNLPKKNNKFIEMCHLLKLKEEESKNPQNQYQFRLYSKLSEEFDPFFLPVYESFMNVKYENQKSNLIKIYNNERAFVNCVISIKESLKSHLNMSLSNQNPRSASESLNNNIKVINPNLKQGFDVSFQNIPQYKFKMKIPYINAFYYGRTDVYFKDIDNFMSMYKENISLASKRLEKDFFENLYKILTFNNTDCKRFLQYLYSNSYFFKYIYNIFTLNKKSDDSLKNVAPLIKRHNDEEPFLNESMRESFFLEGKEKTEEENKLLLIYQSREENKEKEEEEEKANNEDNDFFNSLIGNEFIYKIDIIPEDVSECINKKRIHKFKKIITNKDKFEDNFIITLNNNENMLEIYNLEKKEYLFSSTFDANVCFYDLEKDLKNNIKSDKIIKTEKYILIGQRTNSQTFNNTYIIKLSKEIYSRFIKSISSKGNKIKKTELFSSEENKKDEQEGKLNLEDMLSLRGEEEKNQSDKEKGLNFENDSDKRSSTKNEKDIKFNNKNFSRSMTFRKSSADKSNSGNEKSDNEEKDQLPKNDSSIEVKEKEGKSEESEEDENEDEMKEESDGEEDENDKGSDEENNKNNNVKNSFGKQDSKDDNPINKVKNDKKKEKSDDDENSFKDNINNKFSEENDNNKSDGSGSAKNVNKKANNLEEINTDLDNNIFKNNPTIESKSKSSENEE